jgi:hypothetical protein
MLDVFREVAHVAARHQDENAGFPSKSHKSLRWCRALADARVTVLCLGPYTSPTVRRARDFDGAQDENDRPLAGARGTDSFNFFTAQGGLNGTGHKVRRPPHVTCLAKERGTVFRRVH